MFGWTRQIIMTPVFEASLNAIVVSSSAFIKIIILGFFLFTRYINYGGFVKYLRYLRYSVEYGTIS